MGKLRGKELLSERQVGALRKRLRNNETLSPFVKKQLSLVFTMAIRYIHAADLAAKFSGKYEPAFAEIARSICRTFYTDDDELAGCFGVSPTIIERWRQAYPDFKNAISAGRAEFTRNRGSVACDRRWFYDMFGPVAMRTISEFEPTKMSFSSSFGTAKTSTRCSSIGIEGS